MHNESDQKPRIINSDSLQRKQQLLERNLANKETVLNLRMVNLSPEPPDQSVIAAIQHAKVARLKGKIADLQSQLKIVKYLPVLQRYLAKLDNPGQELINSLEFYQSQVVESDAPKPTPINPKTLPVQPEKKEAKLPTAPLLRIQAEKKGFGRNVKRVLVVTSLINGSSFKTEPDLVIEFLGELQRINLDGSVGAIAGEFASQKELAKKYFPDVAEKSRFEALERLQSLEARARRELAQRNMGVEIGYVRTPGETDLRLFLRLARPAIESNHEKDTKAAPENEINKPKENEKDPLLLNLGHIAHLIIIRKHEVEKIIGFQIKDWSGFIKELGDFRLESGFNPQIFYRQEGVRLETRTALLRWYFDFASTLNEETFQSLPEAVQKLLIATTTDSNNIDDISKALGGPRNILSQSEKEALREGTWYRPIRFTGFIH